MTPLIGQMVKSAAVVVGAWIVFQRFSWREFPALLSWMLWEVAMQSATFGYRDLPASLIIAQDVLCAAVICEVIREARLKLRMSAQVRVLVAAASAAQILSAGQSWYLFRSWFLWAAFIALLVTVMVRWRSPILERKVTKIHRVGSTAWVGVLAVAGSFVKDGVGYMLFPRTMHTWQVMHAGTCVAIAVTAIAMPALMAASAPGRKRAAKKPSGKTVTGLIQTEKAA